MARLIAEVPKEYHRDVKKLALEKGLTVTQLILTALEKYHPPLQYPNGRSLYCYNCSTTQIHYWHRDRWRCSNCEFGEPFSVGK